MQKRAYAPLSDGPYLPRVVTGRPSGAHRRRALRGPSAMLATGILVLSQGLFAAAPDELPALGDASSSVISPALEREIGQQFLQQVHASVPTVDDPVLRYWVERSINDLAQFAQVRNTELHVVLIDSQELNAFAAPGGVVGINLGLILQAEDIHEYSSVLAHELAHLTQRHFARGVEEQQAQSIPTAAALVGAILLGITGGANAGIAAMSAAQAAAISSQLRYSRDREREADRVGLDTMMRADLDPNGMARMFERMQRTYRFSRRPPEFLLTHPLSEARIADARQGAMAYGEPAHPDTPDYAMMRARAIVLTTKVPRDAVTVFEKAVQATPDSVAARYGLALARSRVGDHAGAVALGEALFSATPSGLLEAASLSDLLIEAGRYEQANRLLERVLEVNPDNAALAMLYARSLTKERKFDQAAALLARQSLVHSEDIDVWFQLAEVSGLAGDIIQVHRARAEYFALCGVYERAIQHLEYAKRLVDRSNGPLVARLDQRLNDFRMALREARS